ncbi:MAG: helix-turn-helix transcriptional regulator [Patescibacteria group bacterium]|jgi:DNA-binding XRE family transcriptional regulator
MDYKFVISKTDSIDGVIELLRSLHASLTDGEALSIEKLVPQTAKEPFPGTPSVNLKEQMDVLQEILESQGENQFDLAHKIGIHPATLNELLHGKYRLSATVAKKILNGLKLKPQLVKKLKTISLPAAVMRPRRSR